VRIGSRHCDDRTLRSAASLEPQKLCPWMAGANATGPGHPIPFTVWQRIPDQRSRMRESCTSDLREPRVGNCPGRPGAASAEPVNENETVGFGI
jgi:hypothetical protein